jgi:uncharacterized protein YuzE
MRWHEIDLELIEQTLGTPDWWERSVGGRINCWKRLQGRYIRVTYREEPEEISEGEARRVKIEYDPEADALYIQIREARADDNIDIEEGVTVDIDENRHIVGVEILDASKRLSPSDLSSITILKLPLGAG